jgi:hypothetical protein
MSSSSISPIARMKHTPLLPPRVLLGGDRGRRHAKVVCDVFMAVARRRDNTTGVGFGLALGLTQAIGGTLTAEDTPAGGSP